MNRPPVEIVAVTVPVLIEVLAVVLVIMMAVLWVAIASAPAVPV